MILLVDAGNTRTKWRLIDQKQVKLKDGFLMNCDFSADKLHQQFIDVKIDKIYCSVVSGPKIENEINVFGLLHDCEVIAVKTQKKMGDLTFVYKEYNRLGVDRSLAMLGAFNSEGVLVVDAGSAITADFLDSSGGHLGGYIFPGYMMAREALLGETAKIGDFAGLGSEQLELGVDTASCVNNGFLVMYRALLSELIMKARGLGIVKTILTGGDALFLSKCLDDAVIIESNLVLDGLEKIALKVGKK